jgi:hypothetical protein
MFLIKKKLGWKGLDCSRVRTCAALRCPLPIVIGWYLMWLGGENASLRDVKVAAQSVSGAMGKVDRLNGTTLAGVARARRRVCCLPVPLDHRRSHGGRGMMAFLPSM